MRLNPNRTTVLVASLAASLMAAGVPRQRACGQESSRPGVQDGAKAGRLDDRLFERWKSEAAEYRIVLRTEPETPTSLRAEPVLTWTNPVRGTYDGLVFVWVSGGRPAATACFYRVLREGRYFEAHEFHSLAPTPLIGTLGDRTFWSPVGPGVTAKPDPGGPASRTDTGRAAPPDARPAREFRAWVDVEEGGKELRLLPQPVFRYESDADGALFAFVQATDPEAVMTIDVRPADAGPAWHYAFGRMSNHSLSAKHRDRLVWELPMNRDDHDPSQPYCVRWDVGPR